MKKFLLIVLIWVGVIKLWTILWNYYSADLKYVKSQNYLSKRDTQMAKVLIDQAIQKNPQEPNYYRGKAKILIVSDVNNRDAILVQFKKAEELNPENLVTLRNLIPLYYFLLAPEASVGAVYDEKYLSIVKDFYKRVKENYAHDAGVVSAVARYEKKLGFKTEYRESVEIIRKLRPDLLDWYESFR